MSKPKRIIVLRSRDGIDDALRALRGGPLAIDTETTGLDWTEDLVGSINLAARRTAVVAIKDALAPVARWLGDEVKAERELVFHEAKFDLHQLRETFGLHVPYPVHDTKIESFLVDNLGAGRFDKRFIKKGTHSLKPLTAMNINPDALEPQTKLLAAIKARGGNGIADWSMLIDTEDEHLFTDYAGYDPWDTLELHRFFHPQIVNWQNPEGDYWSLTRCYEMERWLVLAFRDMEERGIMVERRFLENWRDELEVKVRKAKKRLVKLAGRDINWNSHPQLCELLYTKRGLGLVPPHWTKPKRGKEGTHVSKPSTDEVALLTLGHPVGEALINYREATKQHGTYALGLLDAIARDGAIHATFKGTGARTGRTSCEDPNLQQQTRESGVRKAYHARNGLVLRFADLSQVEMRFGAHFANEKTLIRGFINDPDFDTHRATAIVMYGLAGREPSERQRKFGKILNFTTLFGGGVKKVAEQLQERLKLPDVMQALREQRYRPEPGESPYLALARVLKERYANAMPNMIKATREWAEIAEARGYVMTAYGHHRFLDDDRWYSAFNTTVQGTAGGHAKQALVKVYREKQLKDRALACLLLIHDEIVYESDGDPRTDRDVLELMADRTRFRVPIIADMSGSDTTWQDKKKLKLAA
jgi:DNA polymerase I-like protein with 3'-5' exonuclease and polymerase domains